MDEKVLCNLCGFEGDLSKVVVGKGNPLAKLMLIGEAPGSEEDLLGTPFVGRSGKLLDDLLKSSGIDSRNQAYICNVVKCRPPKNRRPTKEEVAIHIPWLNQQIKLIDPFIIILLGATAVEALLGSRGAISSLRGTWQNWEGRLVMPVFHPSYLLRNPSKEDGRPISLTRLDFIKVKQELQKINLNSEESSPQFRSS
tara:strand:+ start:19128 stop:19718 length:591 start_codon:yes stop_codon:yes gene_type:complete